MLATTTSMFLTKEKRENALIMLDFLLKSGADINAVGENKHTILDYILNSSYKNAPSYPYLLDFLKKHGAKTGKELMGLSQ